MTTERYFYCPTHFGKGKSKTIENNKNDPDWIIPHKNYNCLYAMNNNYILYLSSLLVSFIQILCIVNTKFSAFLVNDLKEKEFSRSVVDAIDYQLD